MYGGGISQGNLPGNSPLIDAAKLLPLVSTIFCIAWVDMNLPVVLIQAALESTALSLVLDYLSHAIVYLFH